MENQSRAANTGRSSMRRSGEEPIRWRWTRFIHIGLFLAYILVTAQAIPIDTDKTKLNVEAAQEGQRTQSADTGLLYDRYLREVVELLETDEHFREKIQSADIEDIKSGKISKELKLVGYQIRTKLDELKRQEVARLRMLIRAKLSAPESANIDRKALLQQFNHLNHMNPDTFEPQDLDMLIRAATKDLENFDKERHDEFKRYEMMKEHERREHLKTLNEEQKMEEAAKYEEMKKKHKDHPKVNHPGSQDQLKEVWQETDGLDPNDFDPRTFFNLHDSNGDGYIDEQELEALFTKELEKAYDPKNEEDDMIEMEEERLRMREHVMNEVDVNKDRLINQEEFLRATEKRDFLEPDTWEMLEGQQQYTEDELLEFERHITQTEDELNRKREELDRQQEELQKQHQHIQAQRQELQQVVQQMEQKKQQSLPPSVPEPGSQYQPAVDHIAHLGEVGKSQPLPPGHLHEAAVPHSQPAP